MAPYGGVPGGSEKRAQTVPTGRVIKYPKKCALFCPPGGSPPGGAKSAPPDGPPGRGVRPPLGNTNTYIIAPDWGPRRGLPGGAPGGARGAPGAPRGAPGPPRPGAAPAGKFSPARDPGPGGLPGGVARGVPRGSPGGVSRPLSDGDISTDPIGASGGGIGHVPCLAREATASRRAVARRDAMLGGDGCNTQSRAAARRGDARWHGSAIDAWGPKPMRQSAPLIRCADRREPGPTPSPRLSGSQSRGSHPPDAHPSGSPSRGRRHLSSGAWPAAPRT